MGNSSSGVTAGVKDQADSGSRPLYKYVNLVDGGELMVLMKNAMTTQDMTEVDRVILEETPRFCYNNVSGKKVNLGELHGIWNKSQLATSKDKKEDVVELDEFDDNIEVPGLGSEMEVCWDINQRGGVGETWVHVCLLIGSHVATELAKRIVLHFPKTLNDVYLADEYYGEAPLHQAIVNENPALVKYFVDHGANLHTRCCGNFFTPEDQKPSRTFSANHAWVDVVKKTNYAGHTYWGEYPLTFAASLNQVESFRLLKVKGANPNVRDVNGNTVLHVMVIRNNFEMFDLAYNNGAKLTVKNRLGLTPLTLAARLARDDFMTHILDIERDVLWIYGDTTCASHPLKDIDSIKPKTGLINPVSALALVVYGDSVQHLDLLDGLLEELLTEKWRVYGKAKLTIQFVMFLIHFIFLSLAWGLRPSFINKSYLYIAVFDENGTRIQPNNFYEFPKCYLLAFHHWIDYVRMVMEALVVLSSIMTLIHAIWQAKNVGLTLYQQSMRGFPARTLYYLSCILTLILVPLRFTCNYETEDVLGIIIILTCASHFLFFCRALKMVGPFVLMIYKMVTGDLLRFFIIFMVFETGFQQAFYVIFLSYDNPKTPQSHDISILYNFQESFNRMFIMSIGEFGLFFDNLNKTAHPTLGRVMFVAYNLMLSLMLINLLIAMMGNTYTLIVETKKEYIRQWAAIILNMEQLMTPNERMAAQIQYSKPRKGNKKERALVVNWKFSEEQKENRIKNREEARLAHYEAKIDKDHRSQLNNSQALANILKTLKE